VYSLRICKLFRGYIYIYIYIYKKRLETKDHKYRCLKQDILCTQMSEATSLSKGVPGKWCFITEVQIDTRRRYKLIFYK
jgi:hypothetical protein